MINKARELRSIARKKSTEEANLMAENTIDKCLAYAQNGYTTYAKFFPLYRKSTMKKFFKMLRSYGFKVRKRKIKDINLIRESGLYNYRVVIKW